MSIRLFIVFGTVLLVLMCCACGGSGATPDVNSKPGTPSDSTFPSIPAPHEVQSAALTTSRELCYEALVEIGGNVEHGYLISQVGETDLSYLIYELGPFTEEEQPSWLSIRGAFGNNCYIALADFDRGAWEWTAPSNTHPANRSVFFTPGQYVNPATNTALLVIAFYGPGYSQIDLGKLDTGNFDFYPGDVTLEDANSATVLDGYNAVAGNLIIEDGFANFGSLDGIELVTGSILMYQTDQSQVTFPESLSEVGMSIEASYCPQLEQISFPGLIAAGSIEIIASEYLTTFDLSNLTRCGFERSSSISQYPTNGMTLSRLGQLVNLSFPDLSEMHGIFMIGGDTTDNLPENPGTLSIPNLFEVQELRLYAPSFSILDIPNLTHVDTLVLGSPSLETVIAPRLSSMRVLSIINSESMASLDWLSTATILRDDATVSIMYNPLLTTLKPMENFNQLGRLSNLTIRDCDQLTTLEGLEWAKDALMTLVIRENELLTDASALQGISRIVIDDTITPQKLGSQAVPPIQPVCTLDISDNPALAIFPPMQLTEVEGTILISGNTSITSLGDLLVASSVGGLTIANNPNLTSLEGLENLMFTDTLWIGNNDSLTSLTGLENLYYIKERLYIYNNANLHDLDVLAGLEHIGEVVPGYLIINSNPALTSISGLSNLLPDETSGYVLTMFTLTDNTALVGGDQAGWDLITAWGGQSLIGGTISISGNGS